MDWALFVLQAGGTEAATSFWDRNGDAIETLFVFAAGILFYGLVVNFFYQLISQRVMFGGKQEEGERKRVGGPLGGFLYLLMFPLVSFAFFLLLSMALLFLGGEEQTAQLTLTLAMAVVLAVRVAAYFSEATSHDVAKMLPLGLLGVMLVRAEILQVGEAFSQLQNILDEAGLVLLYFGIVVIVEYVLRTLWLATHLRRPKEPKKPGRPPRPQGAHGAEARKDKRGQAAED